MNDLKFAFRQLAKNPGFTAVAVLTLALGIGVNTAIFNLGQGLLLRPVPGVKDPERLVQIGSTQKGEGFRSLAYADFKDFKTQVSALDLAASYDGHFQVGQSTSTERLRGAVVSGNYFDLLGVRMAAGRALSPGDDTNLGASPVAVISFGLWRRSFAGDPGVLGRTVILNGFPFTVVGVTGAEFKGTERQRELEVWVPMSMLAQAAPDLGAPQDLFSNRAIVWHDAIGRLRPGVSLARARAELETVARRLSLAFPNSNDDRGVMILAGTSANQRDRNVTRQGLTLMLVVAGLALFGACANVTNMQLARALARRREMGIRLSLGASSGRLLRQLFTENLVLTALVGLCGVLLAAWISNLIIAESPADMELGTLRLHLDARVFAFATFITLLTGIASGIVPTWRMERRDITTVLKESSVQTVSSRSPLRNALVVTQVALSLLLLVTAGLFLRTLQNVLSLHSGLAVNSVLVATLDLGPRNYDPARGSLVFEALQERILHLPGVEATSFAATRPFGDSETDAPARPQGSGEDAAIPVGYTLVTPGFFKTLGIPLHEGRDFNASDRTASQPVLIVDERAAKRLCPGRSALGQQLVLGGKLGGQTFQVIGVVPNPRFGSVPESSAPTIYLPYAQHYEPQRVLLLRSTRNPTQLIGDLRASIAAAEPNLQPFAVRTLADELYRSVQPQRATASLVGFFASLALVLATVGIHSLVSWSIAQRTREFGVRVALGARRSDIVRLVLKQASRLLLVGLGTGVVLSLLLTPLLRHQLVGVAFADPLTYASVLAVLALIGFVASYLPAHRGSRVDPMEALRYE